MYRITILASVLLSWAACWCTAAAQEQPQKPAVGERPQPQPWPTQGLPQISRNLQPGRPGPGGEVGPIVIDARRAPQLADLGVSGGENRLDLEFTRTAGTGGLALAFPVGSETAVLVLDCFQEQGTYSGIDWVKGVPLTEKGNPTSHKGKLLESNKPQQLVVEVRRTHILVELNGKKLVDADLGPNDVGGSHLLYPPTPQIVALKLFDGSFAISRCQGRIITTDPRIPEALPAAGVVQLPAAGEARDKSLYAVRFGNSLGLLPESGALVDFQQPFTVECWMRQAREDNEWFKLVSGSMEVEFRKKDVFTKLPEIALTRGGGGISGKISSWDTKWHHVAVSSDEYYSYLYLDGKFVCRAVTAYFGRDTGKKLFQFGWQPGNGSSIRNFAGDLREFRISAVDRYPRSKGFEPPAILGCDEHVTCQLDLREGKLALRRLDKDRLRVSLIVDNVEVIKIPAGE